MREAKFRDFLEKLYPNPNSWKTYLSETKKIEKHIGELDSLYESDRFKNLNMSFEHSKTEGRKPTDSIPHDADPYVTADFRRRCIELYSGFYECFPRRKKK